MGERSITRMPVRQRSPSGRRRPFGARQQEIGRYLAQMTRSRALADDLVQETFLAAIRDVNRCPAGPEARAWLYAIARNRALDALRGIRRARELHARLARGGRASHDVVASSEAVALRDLVVRTLDPADRSLFLLRYFHDFDAPELAALTGLTPAAVRKRLSRSLDRLRRADAPAPTRPSGADCFIEVPDGHR